MIQFEHLTKTFRTRDHDKKVADNICVTFPTGRSVAVLGRNGAGKTTLLKMISGTMNPTSGQILSTGTISWPVGFGGSFHPQLSGAQNARFIARIYGVDTDEMVDFVADFAELGDHFKMPFTTYSAGMKARLAFGVSMAVPFDTYLVDEVTSVGDVAFRRKSTEVINARLKRSGAVVVSHSTSMIRQMCNAGAVLESGRLRYFDDLEDAIALHERNMAP